MRLGQLASLTVEAELAGLSHRRKRLGHLASLLEETFISLTNFTNIFALEPGAGSEQPG
jgi:hypothetical protein